MFPILVVFVISSIISVGTPVASVGVAPATQAVATTAFVGAVALAPVVLPLTIMGTAIVQANQ